VAVDSFGGNTGSTTIGSISGAADLGTDLSEDHPISITYNSALAGIDGELVDPSADGDIDADTVGAAAPYVPLYGGVLQCASCHDVHATGTVAGTPLLRVDDAGSLICLKCHIK
jgi:hypothetical protein